MTPESLTAAVDRVGGGFTLELAQGHALERSRSVLGDSTECSACGTKLQGRERRNGSLRLYCGARCRKLSWPAKQRVVESVEPVTSEPKVVAVLPHCQFHATHRASCLCCLEARRWSER